MSDTVEMFHGTVAANHPSIMRHGLRPAAHGGPYVTPDHDAAVWYAIWVTQAHRARTGESDPPAIVYRLEIPSERVMPASVEGVPIKAGHFVVPGGVPPGWIVDAECRGMPLELDWSDEFAVLFRDLCREQDARAAAVRLGPINSEAAIRALLLLRASAEG